MEKKANLIEAIRRAKHSLEEAKKEKCKCSGTAIQYEGGCCCKAGVKILKAKSDLDDIIAKIIT